ncbi:hypothetical protein D3C78_1309470 [compost metagenome]
MRITAKIIRGIRCLLLDASVDTIRISIIQHRQVDIVLRLLGTIKVSVPQPSSEQIHGSPVTISGILHPVLVVAFHHRGRNIIEAVIGNCLLQFLREFLQQIGMLGFSPICFCQITCIPLDPIKLTGNVFIRH